MSDADAHAGEAGTPVTPIGGEAANVGGDSPHRAADGASQRLPAAGSKPRGLTDPRRYKVKTEYARGGMGRILLATDRALGREVAVKELLGTALHDGIDASLPGTGLSGDVGGAPTAFQSLDIQRTTPADEVTLERFLREARITSRLEHPNIVPVYEIAQRPNGSWYYTMKVVRGKTLAARLREIEQLADHDDHAKTAERLKLLRPFVDVCNAVAYAHSQKVIHRDLKPENVMLGGFGETVLLDWGLALVEGEDPAAVSQALSTRALDKAKLAQMQAGQSATRSSTRLTLDGAVLGTPAYMAPEQARGELNKVDFLSDVWSLGAILYEILAGQRAYATEDLVDLIEAAGKGEYLPLIQAAPDVPPELAALVARAMTPERGSRLRSAQELGAEVDAWIAGRALKSYHYSAREQFGRLVKRHKGAFATAAAALVLLVGGGVWAYTNISAEKETAEKREAEAITARESADTAKAAALTALAERDAETKRREAAEREAAQKDEEVFRKLRAERAAQIADAAKAAAQAPLEPALAAAQAQLDDWKDRKPGDEPGPLRKQANQDAVSALNGAIGLAERLHTLRTEPVAGRAADFATPAELAADANTMRGAKLVAVELAAKTGDYALAEFLLGWAAREGDAMPRGEWTKLDAAEATVALERGALLARRKERITFALDDVLQGLGRKDRHRDAPLLDDYVFELVGYRDLQTVDLLHAVLKGYAIRGGWKEGNWGSDDGAEQKAMASVSTSPTAATTPGGKNEPLKSDETGAGRKKAASDEVPVRVEVRWTQEERDQITLCCRVLGRLSMGWRAAHALTAFAVVVLDHALAIEAGLALGQTGHPYAWVGLYSMLIRFGASSPIGEAMKPGLRRLPPLALSNSDAIHAQFRGIGFIQSGDYDGAIEAFTTAIELALNPSDAAGYYRNRGSARKLKGELDLAIQDFSKAIELNDADTNSYNNRGVAYADKGEVDLALKDYTKAIMLDDTNAAAYSNRGLELFRRGQLDRAMNDFNKVADLNSKDFKGFLLRGLVLTEKGEFGAAIKELDHAINLNENVAQSWAFRGNAYYRSGEFGEAIKNYSRALELDPKEDNALRSLPAARAALVAKPWLTKQATTPSEHLLKAQAHAQFAKGETAAEQLAVAAAEYGKALDAWKDAPLTAEQTRELAETCSALADAYYKHKRHAESYVWYARAVERRAGLSQPFIEAYNAACMAALAAADSGAGNPGGTGNPAGEPGKTVSPAEWLGRAFTMLALSAELGYADAAHAPKDSDLNSLHSDPRWPGILDKFKANAAAAKAKEPKPAEPPKSAEPAKAAEPQKPTDGK